MGLDIYLYKIDDMAEKERQEKLYEKLTDGLWTKFEDEHHTIVEEYGKKEKKITDEGYELYKAECARLAKENDIPLGEYQDVEATGVEQVEIDSKIHPENYFKIGYFRSSYNQGGINRIAGQGIGMTLHDIFPHVDGEYYIQPDWEQSLGLAKEFLAKLKDYANKRPYMIEEFSTNPISMYKPGYKKPDGTGNVQPIGIPQNEDEARQLLDDQMNRDSEMDSGYSNGMGEFTFSKNGPMRVMAVMHGFHNSVFDKIKGIDRPTPCVYIACERDVDWYIEAAEIIVETCEWVLAKDDVSKYYLAWSG